METLKPLVNITQQRCDRSQIRTCNLSRAVNTKARASQTLMCSQITWGSGYSRFKFSQFGTGLRFGFSTKLPGDPEATGPGTAFLLGSRLRCLYGSCVIWNLIYFSGYKGADMNSNGTPFTIFLSCVQNRQVLMSPPYTFPKSPSISPMCSQPSLLLWLQDTHFFPPPLKSKGSLSLLPPLLVPSLSIPPGVLVLGVLKHRTLKV